MLHLCWVYMAHCLVNTTHSAANLVWHERTPSVCGVHCDDIRVISVREYLYLQGHDNT